MNVNNLELITDRMERIAQNTDLNLDYSDLLDDFVYYYHNPVNLNSQPEKLLDLYLINQMQLNNLKAYIRKNGQLGSVYELRYIPGFDRETINIVLPFVTVKPVQKSHSLKPKNIFKYGKHQLVARYNQYFEKPAGFLIPVDSALDYPGSAYLGNMQAWYLRYGFNYKNKIRFGFTFDKDAGEVFLKSKLNDSINTLVGNKTSNLFDFFSGYVYVADMGIVKALVLGDYHLEFGQGLTLWSGLAFGKSAEALNIKRYGRGIRPNTSRNENRFFRGAALTLEWKGLALTGFYSRNKVDASINLNPVINIEEAGSLPETGLHRTINELLKKDEMTITNAGGRISYAYKIFQLGATAFETRLSTPLAMQENLYKIFNFSGNQLMNYGADLNLNLNKVSFFGEASYASTGGWAGVGGMNAFLSDRFVFTLFYHNYSKKYFNLFNNPVAETSSLIAEQGIYFGFKALVYKGVNITGYLDYFNFPWLKYRTDSPSVGRDYLMQINYTASRNLNLYFRFRYLFKQENYKGDYDYTARLADVTRNEFRFFISYQVFDFLIFKNRLEYVFYNKQFEQAENGYLLYQDILYRPAHFPLDITFRYALFSTDGYNSRIYTYENDVLYAFSVPAYFDNGQRVYLLLRYRAFKQLDIWFRLARTVFFDRKTIGSGSDEINGNAKTEVKIQLVVRL
ncbi:MAG: general secretion pathway protein GspK [Chlorobi bacterium]|nr:general secretion pathway protein GspK [Chlorobiota bacterium]